MLQLEMVVCAQGLQGCSSEVGARGLRRAMMAFRIVGELPAAPGLL